MASYSRTSVKVRTTESRGEHDGILFYILPPLLLGAVFAFCYLASGSSEDDGTPAVEEVATEE